MLNAQREVASGSAAVCITTLRAIWDSCRVAKWILSVRCGLLRKLIVGTHLCCGGGCLYYHSSCDLRFVSNCKVSIVGTMWTALIVSAFSMLLWRLLVLSFIVQLEIRVELQSEYCRYDVDFWEGWSLVLFGVAVEAACITILRAIGDSCRVAKLVW